MSGSSVQPCQAPFSFVSQRSSGSELDRQLPGQGSFPLPGRPVHWGRSIVPGCLRRRVRPEPMKDKPTWAATLVVHGAGPTRAQQRLAQSRRFQTELARTSPRPARGGAPPALQSLWYQLPARATPRETSAAQQWPDHAASLLRCRLLHTGHARDAQPRHLLPQVSARARVLVRMR